VLKRLISKRRFRARYGREDLITAAICLLPAVLVLGAFVVIPIFASGYLSLTSWDGFSLNPSFVGLRNYARLLQDGEFWNSLLVTVLYALGMTLLSCALGLFVALLLDAPLRGRGLYRTIYFLPVVTSSIAAAVVWRYLFDPAGYANVVLEALHLPAPNWLGDRWLALLLLTLLTAWKYLGFNTILYLTALQAIPTSLYEAANLDGASVWHRFRYVTFPLLLPMTFFVVVQSVINSFQAFDLVYVLTSGGPLGGTDVIGFFMYRQAFRLSEFGYGASIAYFVFALVFSVTLVQWRLTGSGQSPLR
jgi:multiple sugar transport system permease protein